MSDSGRKNLLELRRISGEGIDPVVVFVHSSSGSASGFRRLAGHLRAPGRYLAFEAVEPGGANGCSVTAIADDYWRALQPLLQEEPRAALRFVGWSFCGVLSMEMARLAEDAGHRVVGVSLLDAATPRVLACRRDARGGVAGRDSARHICT